LIPFACPGAGDAPAPAVGKEQLRCRELGDGALSVAGQPICRTQEAEVAGYARKCVPRPFEPLDRLIGAALQQMRLAHPGIPVPDDRIARAEPHRALEDRDRFFERPTTSRHRPISASAETLLPPSACRATPDDDEHYVYAIAL
jgi:hypothetical protein